MMPVNMASSVSRRAGRTKADDRAPHARRTLGPVPRLSVIVHRAERAASARELDHPPRGRVDEVHVVEVSGQTQRDAFAGTGIGIDAAAHLGAVEAEID